MSSGDDKQRRLGRGLSALLPNRGSGTPAPPAGTPVVPPVASPMTSATSAAQPVTAPAAEPPKPAVPTRLPVSEIQPNPNQPRETFHDDKLEELAASIRAHGIIQPVVVRKLDSGYQIIAGERRWRAAQLAGLNDLPIVIQEVTDDKLLEVALIENIQREDLNPIETAQAFDRLSRELGLSHEEIGRRTGKDRATIANLIRLLRLPNVIQKMLEDGRLQMGHARALLALPSPDAQMELAEKASKSGWSVRQVEREVQHQLASEDGKPEKAAKKLDPNVRAAMEELERALGTRVRIVQGAGGKRGRIEIEYYSPEELDRLYGMLVQDSDD